MGGEVVDNVETDCFAKGFKRNNKECDLTISSRLKRRLRTQTGRAKRTLFAAVRGNIEVDSWCNQIIITRTRFEDLCMHYFRQCLEPVPAAVKDAKMSKSDVNDIVLDDRIIRYRNWC